LNAGARGVFVDPTIADQLSCVIVLCQTRADWPAICTAAGLRQWSHNLFPCFCCGVTKDELSHPDLHAMSLDFEPWENYSRGMYDADIDRHRISLVVPDLHTRSLVFRTLQYGTAYGGRGLKDDLNVNGVQLRKHDTLEPGPDLRDVAKFETMAPPFTVCFWRRDKNARVFHASPLLTVEGYWLSLHVVDLLHTWHLGCLCAYVPLALRLILDHPIFFVRSPSRSAADCRKIAMIRLKVKLLEFYRWKRQNSPDWRKRGSEIWQLTEKMLGSRKRPELKAKAAEARGLLEFSVWVLKLLRPTFVSIGGIPLQQCDLLIASGEAAFQFDQLLVSNPCDIPRPAIEQLWSTYVRHVAFYRRAGGLYRPKHHLMFHMIKRISSQCNPRFVSMYKDESLNGVIARIGRSVHRTQFGLSVHMKFSVLVSLKGTGAENLHP
jgi:hypothetical protein